MHPSSTASDGGRSRKKYFLACVALVAFSIFGLFQSPTTLSNVLNNNSSLYTSIGKGPFDQAPVVPQNQVDTTSNNVKEIPPPMNSSLYTSSGKGPSDQAPVVPQNQADTTSNNIKESPPPTPPMNSSLPVCLMPPFWGGAQQSDYLHCQSLGRSTPQLYAACRWFGLGRHVLTHV